MRDHHLCKTTMKLRATRGGGGGGGGMYSPVAYTGYAPPPVSTPLTPFQKGNVKSTLSRETIETRAEIAKHDWSHRKEMKEMKEMMMRLMGKMDEVVCYFAFFFAPTNYIFIR